MILAGAAQMGLKQSLRFRRLSPTPLCAGDTLGGASDRAQAAIVSASDAVNKERAKQSNVLQAGQLIQGEGDGGRPGREGPTWRTQNGAA